VKNAASICNKAAELVNGDRAVTHGDMNRTFTNIASIWNAIIEAKQGCVLHVTLDPEDVANMLEGMKIARRYSGAFNADDYIDAAGYAGCAGELAGKRSTS
jgi:hypothetical protein